MGIFSKKPKLRNPLNVAQELMQLSRIGDLAKVKLLVEEVKTMVPSDAELFQQMLDKGQSEQEIIETIARTGLRNPVLAETLAIGLFEAASAGHTEVVEHLSVQGANLDRQHAENGDTAIGIAAYGGHDKIVQFLAWRVENVNTANESGITPLMLAAAKCCAETVSKLLDRGAEVCAISNDGLMARDFATFELRDDVCTVLNAAAKSGLNTEGKNVGLDAPVAIGGTCIGSYETGGLMARIFTDLESIGPIKYLHVLELSAVGATAPILYVTAEVNTLLEDLENFADSEVTDLLKDVSGDVVLGLFDSAGHHHLGVIEGLDDVSVFSSKARDLLIKMIKQL